MIEVFAIALVYLWIGGVTDILVCRSEDQLHDRVMVVIAWPIFMLLLTFFTIWMLFRK